MGLGTSHRGVEALLAAELEERERRAIERRIKDAHLLRVKTLDEFDFRQAPLVSPTRMSELAEGSYIERAEPIVFTGDSGTGKTHLVSALVVAACRQRKRARFITAAALVNELVEAKQQLQLRRVLGRWARYDLIAIDEVGRFDRETCSNCLVGLRSKTSPIQRDKIQRESSVFPPQSKESSA